MASPYVISVLLTAFNCEKFLPDTLGSLKNACIGVEDDVEIILVNDASSDKTSEILHDFASKHPHARAFDVSLRNIGKVRNFAVGQCRGQYVTMLDGDDLLLKNSLSDIVSCLKKEQPDALLAALNEVYENKKNINKWHGLTTMSLTQHQTIEKFLIHRDLQAHFIGQFIKREILEQNHFPDFSCYEDAYLFPSILNASHHILYASQSPYLYFKRAQSLSSDLDAEKVSMLIFATQRMDEVFQDQYRNLLSCHWINIVHKYYPIIKNENEKEMVKIAISKIPVISFLADSKVRTSIKRKYFKMKLKGTI